MLFEVMKLNTFAKTQRQETVITSKLGLICNKNEFKDLLLVNFSFAILNFSAGEFLLSNVKFSCAGRDSEGEVG